MNLDSLKSRIRAIENWPRQGVIFRDITPVLENKESFKFLIDQIAELAGNEQIDKIVGIDARGFILE